jgi:hypothetical protein
LSAITPFAALASAVAPGGIDGQDAGLFLIGVEAAHDVVAAGTLPGRVDKRDLERLVAPGATHEADLCGEVASPEIGRKIIGSLGTALRIVAADYAIARDRARIERRGGKRLGTGSGRCEKSGDDGCYE